MLKINWVDKIRNEKNYRKKRRGMDFMELHREKESQMDWPHTEAQWICEDIIEGK
jgi:hypothetical protein